MHQVLVIMLPRDSAFFSSASFTPTLRLTRGAETILMSGREPFSLRGREALRYIALALARARRASPGEAVAVNQLFEAGWPGTTASISNAVRAQRVYAAISRLRRLGMQGIIERNGDGYFVDPKWRVELDAAPHLDEPYGIFGAA